MKQITEKQVVAKRPYRYWTTKEIAFLKENAEHLSILEIAIALNRNVSSVKYMRRKIGLKPHKRRWTTAEIKTMLCLRNKGLTYSEIAERLKRSENSVVQQMGRLKKKRRGLN